MIYCIDKVNEYLYDGAFATPLIGTDKTLKSINRNELVKKFDQVYCPNNMILCIVGDANFDDIVNFAEKNFENNKGLVQQVKFSERNKEGIEERKGLTQSNLILTYHVPKANNSKSYAAEILNAILAGGMSSRLFHEIREKRNLAYSVKGDCDINKNYAFNLIYVGTNKDNVDKIKELIIEELEKVSHELGNKELQEAKEQLIGNYMISMEDSQNQMINLLYSEISNNAEEYYKYEKNILNVKIEDVKELAEKAFRQHSFFALNPK